MEPSTLLRKALTPLPESLNHSGLQAAAQLDQPALEELLRAWLREDIGRGDLTAPALIGRRGRAHWTCKQAGLFCGGVLLEPLFQLLDPALELRLLVADGEPVQAGQRLVELDGLATALVAAERTALNLAMRLSGIATATATLVAALEGTGVRLADTRKTTPGLRLLEKYAVRCGGGLNHRLGLDDAAMLKENHLAWGGGLEAAMAAVRGSAPWPARLIVEAETAAEAEAAVRAGADGVLLDEFSPAELAQLVPRLRALAATGPAGRVVLEASGIQPEQLRAYAATGIDLISSSAPITRAPWLDLSMRFTEWAA
ncbi:carboxylating nicotinate-nucleotide diphosphorylase [Synechococcus sp. CS-602]|uniref:carboxylating nicotinate-nucleotide diphosphorylase n=1 Tax=Synechococcaceae TaxID=1890426 RepID=UPI0009FAA09A|nr:MULTISPECIES: carboxylating nicotinate-nucleotide diphosphorylase [Synechococcaceae]MCT0200966.1 carboxylating nicotinate-nucleotide diphosphorylase [Synechococcus sp. CS-603]MCT0244768.1 carboxylating nicotinate-nucleotide diphosphorylase [Synechococcus sp. CS-601]MCT4363729.1 carboxylating nicotinate-nucleotide diphosphorylase [Candidatus Regnicoccus frigidus MAG-AL1]TWB91465.1 nicotinate-nucleotide pyrophosphorylase [carboxylating] [Synechococcus sp. Ace-Pa]MCT0204940.1 carboxylating nic